MFQIQNVPIVIEPGVNAVEAEFFAAEKSGKTRSFPVQLFRVVVDEHTAQSLPFVASVRFPHVFSLSQNPEVALVMVVYDAAGRISFVYTRDTTKKTWEKREVADEHAGRTVKQFSIRYFFNSERSRDEFMKLVDNIVSAVHNRETPNQKDINTAFNLLSRARTEPVVLPIAVAKADMKKLKI